MSYSTLCERLHTLSGRIRPPKGLDKLNPASGFYQEALNSRVDNSDGVVEEIVAAFPTIPELAPYNEGTVRSSPTSEGTIKWSTIADWLLAQAQFRPADEVVEQLKNFVSSDSTNMSEVVALWGLHPTTQIKLTDDIYLVPINALVQSGAKDTVTGTEQNIVGVSTFFPKPRCTSALKREFVHRDILIRDKSELNPITQFFESLSGAPSIESLQESLQSAAPELLKRYAATRESRTPNPASERLREIVKCLCLINDTPVCEVASWYECLLSTPMIGGVRAWGGQAIEQTFHFQIEPTQYDENLAREIVKGFLKLSESDRQRLHIPLSRLNSALRASDDADKALDLGIAIESLLGPADTDISYKVRQRGTVLLGGTPNDKRLTFDYLKSLYELRSKVAHGKTIHPSQVKVGKERMQTHQFLKNCSVICARMIREIIKSGFVSDWDGKLLGW